MIKLVRGGKNVQVDKQFEVAENSEMVVVCGVGVKLCLLDWVVCVQATRWDKETYTLDYRV